VEICLGQLDMGLGGDIILIEVERYIALVSRAALARLEAGEPQLQVLEEEVRGHIS